MQQKQQDDKYDIDLLKLLLMLVKRWWLIIIVAALCAAIAFTVSARNDVPIYSASAMMYISTQSISLNGSAVSVFSQQFALAERLVETYSIILKTRSTLNEVSARSGYNLSYDTLNGMVSAAAVNETEILSITVKSTDPQMACDIANTITEVLPEKITEVIKGSTATTVDKAVLPTTASTADHTKQALIWALIGVVASAAVIWIIELSNDKVNSEEWIIDTFGKDLPLLAVIPDSSGSSNTYGYGYGGYGYGYGYYGTSKPKKRSQTNNEDSKNDQSSNKPSNDDKKA